MHDLNTDTDTREVCALTTGSLKIELKFVDEFHDVMHFDFNTLSHLFQTDVSGTCDVSYKVESTSWGTKTIKKTKDLLTCSGRHSADTILQAVHYDVPSVSLKQKRINVE